MDHNKLWKILRVENTRSPYLSPEKRVCGSGRKVRTRCRTTDWFKIEKGVWQGCIFLPSIFNVHAEYIIQNARLNESPAGITTARRNINNLIYADDTTLMAESEEEIKSLLIRVKQDSEKALKKLRSCIPVADSFWYMAKSIQYCKVKKQNKI